MRWGSQLSSLLLAARANVSGWELLLTITHITSAEASWEAEVWGRF